MSTWTKEAFGRRCGGCGHWVEVGASILRLDINARITKWRGVCCAGDAPPDLPAVVVLEETPAPAPMPSLAHIALPADWRQRQANEREPGEDG